MWSTAYRYVQAGSPAPSSFAAAASTNTPSVDHESMSIRRRLYHMNQQYLTDNGARHTSYVLTLAALGSNCRSRVDKT